MTDSRALHLLKMAFMLLLHVVKSQILQEIRRFEARNTKGVLFANTSDVRGEILLYIGCQKSGETGGRESEGRSGLMKLVKLVQNGKI